VSDTLQDGLVAVAVEHRNSELPFDLSDLVADCGLYLVQMLSRTGQTAVSDEGLKGFQPIQIEFHGYSDLR
jgi:hypothetical protein